MKTIEINHVPDGRTNPVTNLLPLGRQIIDVQINHSPVTTVLPPNIDAHYREIKRQEDPTSFFDGPFLNTLELRSHKDTVQIDTENTTCFSYYAATYTCQNEQTANPITPLSFETTMIGINDQDEEAVITFRRGPNVNDMPGKLGLPSAAFNVDENPVDYISRIIHKKTGVQVLPSQISIDTISRENINKIACILTSVPITREDTLSAMNKLGIGSENLKPIKDISNLLEQGITDWNPNSWMNLLATMVNIEKITPENAKEIYNHVLKKLKQQPYLYDRPIARFFSPLNAS